MKPKSQTYYQPLAASSSTHDSLRRISRMASLPLADVSCYGLSNNRAILLVDFPVIPLPQMGGRPFQGFATKGKLISKRFCGKDSLSILRRGSGSLMSKKLRHTAVRSGSSSNSGGSEDNSSDQGKKPFGYNRKDVLLIGVGVTVFGISLKSGLEFAGIDHLQAGNVVQLVCVLGLTIGWISTYIFRVSNKEMTYAQQLRDYENKVMQKRLDSLTEAEVEVLLEQVEEDKRRVANGEQIK